MGRIRIALDAMGGDFGPRVTVPAAALALEQTPELLITLVGDKDILQSHIAKLKKQKIDLSRLTILHASQTVAMDESPAQALRTKKDSSMRVAINSVKNGEADACVSAGNTGALMATARFVLKTLPGIDRPAIVFGLPTLKTKVYMLDLGANIDCTAEHLFQFAVMGSVLAKSVKGVQSPRVALLNIGEEEIKGNETVKTAARLISEAKQINYVGFVEGTDIYSGNTDVIVCDGFVGNIALKASEGILRSMAQIVKQYLTANWWRKCLGLIIAPVLKRMAGHLDPRKYNGACFIGLRGIVIKSHGGADRFALATAINEAVKEVYQNVPSKIQQEVAQYMQERQAS